MKIGITCGDTNGIGLEIFYKSIPVLARRGFFAEHSLVLICNPATLNDYFSKMGLEATISGNSIDIGGVNIELRACAQESPVEFGQATKSSGVLAAAALDESVAMLGSGEIAAVTTLPIAKHVMALASWGFMGHTEFFAASQGPSSKPLMILFAGSLRVALATIHTPICEVPRELSPINLLKRLEIFSASLRTDFAIENPRIAVLGLNPHAGEEGKIGQEELDVIKPVISTSNSRGANAEGPFSADAFFARKQYEQYDGVLAMYHDQGLIPLKMLGGSGGVNFTAGLRCVRTSPDHGTAFPIAGRGTAEPDSLVDAVLAAEGIVRSREKMGA